MNKPPALPDLQRRTAIQTLGAVGAGLIMPMSLSALGASTAAEPLPASSKSASAYSLSDIRLGEGPFLAAQQRAEGYLLSLSPDRLLHNFHDNAGLKPKAAVYGGWESQEPWIDIRCQGHSLGHYLSGCALMYASTGKVEFKQRCDYLVAELKRCQDASNSGLVCAFPDGAAQLQNMVGGREFLGVPWYTMHKIFAGLHDAFVYTANPVALQVLTRLADWAVELTRPLTDTQFQRMLEREHGGMCEALAETYVLTNQRKYLDCAERFVHRALLDPLAQGRDPLDGLHSNTQIPKVIGMIRLYQLTGRDDYRSAAEFFWRTVVETRTYATGGNGDIEFFFPRNEFEKRLASAKTMETCCFYNMLRLTRLLFETAPAAAYADYYERALYNGILGSQDPQSGMVTYFQPTRPNYPKIYCTPIDSFWCCTGSGMESHAKYGDSAYFRAGNSIYVNLFMPSTLRWHEQDVTLTQSTRFPESTTTELRIVAARPVALRLKIRHPFWCDAVTVKINGKQHGVFREKSRYIDIERRWKTGDVVTVDLPMHLRTEPLPGAPDIVALMYGPLVLAGRFGTSGMTAGADIVVNERTIGQMLQEALPVPEIPLDKQNPARQIERSDADKLAFLARGVAGRDGLQLIPYSQIAHERYNLYWRVLSA